MATAMKPRPPPASGVAGTGHTAAAQSLRQFGVDMARVTPRVAGQSYGVSSIPSLPPASQRQINLAGVKLDTAEADRGSGAPRPTSRRGGNRKSRSSAEGSASARSASPRRRTHTVGGDLLEPRPPSAPQTEQLMVGTVPFAAAEHKMHIENAGILDHHYDAGALSLDVMMPIYAELERKFIRSVTQASSLGEELGVVQKNNAVLLGRVQTESQNRIRMDAKILQLTSELNKARETASRAEQKADSLQDELESSQRVISSLQQRLQTERRKHGTTNRQLAEMKAKAAKLKHIIDMK